MCPLAFALRGAVSQVQEKRGGKKKKEGRGRGEEAPLISLNTKKGGRGKTTRRPLALHERKIDKRGVEEGEKKKGGKILHHSFLQKKGSRAKVFSQVRKSNAPKKTRIEEGRGEKKGMPWIHS